MSSSSAEKKSQKPEASKASGRSPAKSRPAHLSLVEDAPNSTSRRFFELAGVVVMGLAVLLSMALLSYQPVERAWADPSASQNWVGPAGEIMADLLFAALGFGAYLIAASVFVFGLMLLRSVALRVGVTQFFGLGLVLLGATTILHISLSPVVDIPFPPGGLLGVLLGDLLARYFAVAGATVLAATVLTLGLLVTTELSPSLLVTAIHDGGQFVVRSAVDYWAVQKERSRLRQERRAERKRLAAELASVAKQEAAEEALRKAAHKAEQKALRQQKVSAKVARLAAADAAAETERLAHEAEQQFFADNDDVETSSLDTAGVIGLDNAMTDPGSPTFAQPEQIEATDNDSDSAADSDDDDQTAQSAGGKQTQRSPLLDPPWVADFAAQQPAFATPVDDENAALDGVQKGTRPSAQDLAAQLADLYGDEDQDLQFNDSLDDDDNDEAFAAAVPSPGEAQPTLISGPPAQMNTAEMDGKQQDKSASNDASPRIIEYKAQEPDPNKVVQTTPRAERQASPYVLPDLHLLDYDAPNEVEIDQASLSLQARKLEKIFGDYGIEGKVREIRPGPVVTTYEFVPKAGTRIAKIASLSDDLAMAMEAIRVRVVAPIPGKGAVGIEIPNVNRQSVFLKEIIAATGFQRAKSKLAMAIGKDIEGRPVHVDLAKMPHMLIAGTTGSGKSVAINTLITSILYKATPEEVRFLMIDPKMLELSMYEGIPHLLLPPVTDPKKASAALHWAVAEMERRYQLLAENSVRDISGYNKKLAKQRSEHQAGKPLEIDAATGQPIEIGTHMPYIVVVIDEFADLMMVASRDVESYIARLAQKARACGIHVLLATQRPSTDVITGVIKANFPVRMSFQVASQHDSKTIINAYGAEKLLGKGDMLLIPPGGGPPQRCHGAFVSEDELHEVVAFLKTQGEPVYDESILKSADSDENEAGANADEEYDEHFDLAVAIVAENQQVSVSMIQRKLKIGYNRAARIVERMELDGMVGPQLPGNKPREVYLPRRED